MNNITRKIVLSLAAVATVGSLTACSTGTGSDAEGPLDRSGSTSSASTNEALYIQTYESEFGAIDSNTEDSLIELGYTVCDSLDDGMTFDEIGNASVGTGIGLYEAGFIVGDAVGAFCPVYVDDLTDWASGYGITA